MQRERADAALLWDMLRAAEDVQIFIQGRTLEQYINDPVLKAAVERKIEIVGEAARYVSATFQAAHPEIPWRPIQAQRHVIAHDYGEIVDEKLWRVATEHIPPLIEQLRILVPPPPVEP
jgi:uncharacterized protein with HEPN domain